MIELSFFIIFLFGDNNDISIFVKKVFKIFFVLIDFDNLIKIKMSVKIVCVLICILLVFKLFKYGMFLKCFVMK